MKPKEFEIFYNSLSVGWHLRRIAEADESETFKPQELLLPEQYEMFKGWLERHNLKQKEETCG